MPSDLTGLSRTVIAIAKPTVGNFEGPSNAPMKRWDLSLCDIENEHNQVLMNSRAKLLRRSRRARRMT